MQLKLLKRIATVKDDGTVEFEVPGDVEPLPIIAGQKDSQPEFSDAEPLDCADLQDIPPLEIVMLIVGTRGDVQPFIAIGKRLQVTIICNVPNLMRYSLMLQMCNPRKKCVSLNKIDLKSTMINEPLQFHVLFLTFFL